MSSLSDLLTVTQNLVQSVNGLAQNYFNVQGNGRVAAVASTTQAKIGQGRVCVMSVLVAGSTTGSIYDAATVSATTNKIAVIPNTVGIYVVNIPVQYGVVVAPGASQVVTVSYS